MTVLEEFGQDLMSLWKWMLRNVWYMNLIFSIVIVFFQRRDPRSVWTWLFALNFLPVFGAAFFLLFGQDYHRSRMFRIKAVEDRLQCSADGREPSDGGKGRVSPGMWAAFGGLIRYNLNASGSVLTTGNELEVFTDGQRKFADLRRELRLARHHIHLEYYIIKNDQVFASIMPILMDKAAAGVEVRLLADGMGGRFLSRRDLRMLRKSGVRVAFFFPPFLGRLHFRINYRNHRKIVVIDGRLGYVGGFNIGKEYISADPRFGCWRDTHLKIRGDAALGLQIRFALDWNYAARENLFLRSVFFGGKENRAEERQDRPKRDGGIGIQIVSSGPDSRTGTIRDNYLELICRARDHIYIQTPYFVPDDAVMSALRIAAGSGVDVRLMIPCRPDHPFVYWATCAWAGDLLEAGGRCFVYEHGFLHAKCITVDGMAGCCGTANMDIRSFALNFEVNAVIYDEEAVSRLERIFQDDLLFCREITAEEYRKRSLGIRAREQFSRLLSPIL